MRRRAYFIALSALLVLVAMLSACSNEPSSGNGQSEPSAADQESNMTEAGTFPIVKEKTTLRVLIRGHGLVQDFVENEFTKWYEEKTNVHIEFDVAPEKNSGDKLSLVLASGDLPDIILGFNMPDTQVLVYGQQGIFLPLNDLIEKYGVNTKQEFEKYPVIFKDRITAPDGNIYALPNIENCYHCSMSQRMWIYTPWLEKLGLEMPTTTEEFYQVLKAFKEQDPNGNGKQDEIPLTGAIDTPPSYLDAFLMNSFIYNNYFQNNRHLYVDNGKIDTAFNKPQWKEGLQYLNRLYEEGLIAPESFTQDTTQLRQLGENPDTVILGVSAGHNMGVMTQYNSESGRWLEYKAIPPLKGPDGVQLAAYDPYGGNEYGAAVITNSSKNPEIAFRWLDGFYDYEASFRNSYGVEGKQWEKAQPGDKGLDGRPATWRRLEEYGAAQSFGWFARALFDNAEMKMGEAVFDPETNLEAILYNETKNKMEPYQVSMDQIVPPLYFGEQEAAEISDLSNTINDYVNEMKVRFITGDADIEQDWESYLKTLEGMNLARYLEIYQQAFEINQNKS